MVRKLFVHCNVTSVAHKKGRTFCLGTVLKWVDLWELPTPGCWLELCGKLWMGVFVATNVGFSSPCRRFRGRAATVCQASCIVWNWGWNSSWRFSVTDLWPFFRSSWFNSGGKGYIFFVWFHPVWCPSFIPQLVYRIFVRICVELTIFHPRFLILIPFVLFEFRKLVCTTKWIHNNPVEWVA